MKKIKVLQFTIAASQGGRTQYILNNWKNIDKNRFQFDFITFSSNLDFADELEAQGCLVYYISCYPEEDKIQFIKELDKILENGYDVIHVHTSYWRSFIVEERAKANGIKKIIIHSHGTGINKAISQKEALELEEEHYRVRECINETLADEFLACSKSAAEWLYGNRISKSRIKIVHNAINTNKYKYNQAIREAHREQLGWKNKFVIGQVARFVYQKNHEFTIDVFKDVCKLIPNAILVLVGDGALKGKIEEKVRRYELTNRVYFTGLRKDVNVLLQSMDVLVLPSLYEALGIALIEAQTSGLPCIASEGYTTIEAKITELLEYEELIVDKWTDRIYKIYEKMCNNTFAREDKSENTRAAGYDIVDAIKLLEKIYEGI